MSAHTIDITPGPADILPASHDQEQMAIATFLARYTGHTLVCYRIDLRDYMAFCRSIGVGMLQVERGHLELYIRELESRGYAQSTVARKFGTVYLFLEYAEIDDRIPKNPARKVSRPKIDKDAQHRTWFEIGEIHAIITRCRRNVEFLEELLARCVRPVSKRRTSLERRLRGAIQDLALLQLLATTGMRVGEVCSLDTTSLHFDAGVAYLEYTRKGHKVTRTKLPMETLLVLMRQIDTLNRQDGPLFVTGYGSRMRRNNVAAVITRLARSVGITRNVTPHGMRRTFASTAIRLGASHTDLQHAMNHADPRTTSLYLMGEKGGSVSRQLVAELLAS